MKVDPQVLASLEREREPKPAPQPAAISNALLPPLRVDLPRGNVAPIEQRFDLVVNNAPAQQVFMSIVSGTRYSMVVHPEVSGMISVNLKDVTVLEALQAVREVYGYEYRLDGTRLYVQAAGLQTRVFQVNYLMTIRAGRSDVRVTSGSNSATVTNTNANNTANNTANPNTGTGTQGAATASSVTTTSQSDFWAELNTSLRSMVGSGPGRNVVINQQSGVVAITAMPAELRTVETFLNAIRASVNRQVMLEAKIIDVTLNESTQSGINWAAFPTSGTAVGLNGSTAALAASGAMFGNLVTAAPGSAIAQTAALSGVAASASRLAGASTIGLALQTQNFAALLEFLESQGTIQVLSSPRVATMNNQKAVLKVGADQGFVTSVSTSDPTVSNGTVIPGRTSVTLASFFDGVSLDITPQIDDQGNILLHIHPLVSRVEGGIASINANAGVGNFTTPRSIINETDTVVRVQDGNIVALGGLMQVTLEAGRSGVPGLQDSAAGALFGNRGRTSVKKELILLIKPTVIESDRPWGQDLKDARERLSVFGSQ